MSQVDALDVINELQRQIGEQAKELAVLRVQMRQLTEVTHLPSPLPPPPD